jgi:hypothetical protein
MVVIARGFDVAPCDARYRALGPAGKELVLDHERAVLLAAEGPTSSTVSAGSRTRMAIVQATISGASISGTSGGCLG